MISLGKFKLDASSENIFSLALWISLSEMWGKFFPEINNIMLEIEVENKESEKS